MKYRVRSVPQEIADEVRRTHRAPGYGHPAHLEVASGTGPCRCCLRPFLPGVERRLLFTYLPHADDDGGLMAPGPVFIHAEHCEAYSGDGFSETLRSLPLAFEARTSGSRVSALLSSTDVPPERQMSTLFSGNDVRWLHVRHAQAGCFIARVDRVE